VCHLEDTCQMDSLRKVAGVTFTCDVLAIEEVSDSVKLNVVFP
jgi:hypothetical protein